MDYAEIPVKEKVKALHVREQGSIEVYQESPAEYPLKVFLNDSYYSTLNCTPQYLKELVVGNLYAEGYFEHYSQVSKLESEPENQRAEIVVEMEKVIKLPIQLFRPVQVSIAALRKIAKTAEISPGLKNISGVKCAGLYKAGKETVKAEDISSLNAADKVIGYCLMRGIELKDKVFFLNDRITSDILSKVIRAGITVVLSQITPTDLSIKIALDTGIVLVSLEGENLNIFTNPHKTDLT